MHKPTPDRELLAWGAAAFGLVASLAVLVYGASEGDVVAVGGAIGAAWAMFALAVHFFRPELRVREAQVHRLAGAALIFALAFAVDAWRQMLYLLAAYLVAFEVYFSMERRGRSGGAALQRDPAADE